ncbi:hypothetical protein D0A34_13935 [Microcoleus vaginatus PCC 9802]|uniref:hypothetical protein n=1 Tax=Microcoleus vaginatus TaxID=119532 RepID=UPI0003092D3B|nr:hypothetical protein D0A34_13935 [Microcoleus vaginatus PCC 9802]
MGEDCWDYLLLAIAVLVAIELTRFRNSVLDAKSGLAFYLYQLGVLGPYTLNIEVLHPGVNGG